MGKFNLKTKVSFGLNSLNCLKAMYGGKAFIVTDEAMQKLGFVDKVTTLLQDAGFTYKIFADVVPDPDIKIVTYGLKQMMETASDVIIAVGGGSVIDSAKCILYTYAKMTVEEEVKLPKLIAIPTTSGTGSEVTAFSVITINGEKLCLIDDIMMPDYAIVDPVFVKTLPSFVTAETGLDALSHAIEAYVSTNSTDFTDALVEKSVKLLFDNLLLVYRQNSDMLARERVHNASCMAGMAFTNTSLGITHSIAHAIGGIFHLSHGRTVGIMLPHVIAYNANIKTGSHHKIIEKYARLAKIIGLPANNAYEGCQNLIRTIRVLMQEMNVPIRFSGCEITEELYKEKLPIITRLALADNCTLTNPRIPDDKDVIKLVLDAY